MASLFDSSGKTVRVLHCRRANSWDRLRAKRSVPPYGKSPGMRKRTRVRSRSPSSRRAVICTFIARSWNPIDALLHTPDDVDVRRRLIQDVALARLYERHL